MPLWSLARIDPHRGVIEICCFQWKPDDDRYRPKHVVFVLFCYKYHHFIHIIVVFLTEIYPFLCSHSSYLKVTLRVLNSNFGPRWTIYRRECGQHFRLRSSSFIRWTMHVLIKDVRTVTWKTTRNSRKEEQKTRPRHACWYPLVLWHSLWGCQ